MHIVIVTNKVVNTLKNRVCFNFSWKISTHIRFHIDWSTQ